MKKIKIFLAFLLALSALPLFSETEAYDKGLDRIVDIDGQLNEDELREVNDTFIRAVDAFKFDMPVVLKNSFGQDLESWCDSFFSERGYGYGSNKNAIVLVIETDTDNVLLKGYGAGKEILTDEENERLIELMMEHRAKNHTWLLCIWTYLNDVLDLLKANEPIRDKYADGKLTEKPVPQGKKPYWYPEDVNSFVDFHDENASRVVDDAHIFSDSEIAQMKERIKKIQDESGFDLVVFTDTSSYGLSHGVYAA
ncbi:MAG: TPM domain-containing protein, partial [Treponema sp.]|nr:TPM domain-containing protein [Treponema sp.]